MHHFEEALENYLKEIYDLGGREGRVSTGLLAKRLNLAPASATEMTNKLANAGFVTVEPYHGAQLTTKGTARAESLWRKHRLLEVFLHTKLNVPNYYEEAHKLEHALSDDVADKLDAFLGHPDKNPDGKPIPKRASGTNSTPAELSKPLGLKTKKRRTGRT